MQRRHWMRSSSSSQPSSSLQGSVKLAGVAASEGVAVGCAFVHLPGRQEPERKNISATEIEKELDRFREAVTAVARALSETAKRLRESGGAQEADIFEAHAEMAEDPELLSGVDERVRRLQSPEAAVLAVGEEYAGAFAATGDEYMAARADDVRDVAAQIAAELVGGAAEGLEALGEPAVILARSLAPSETARIPRGMALGFVTAEGSRTSHVSIMARSMGIPAVVGVGVALDEALGAQTVAVDGYEGLVIADPGSVTTSEFESRREELAAKSAALEAYRHVEARTPDGRRIEVSANIGSSSEVHEALSWGAEGVGLFRTEFLFMERDELPSEDEQYEAYRRVAEAFSGKPVVVRTLDVGGDKELPGVEQPSEENPFLGWRGIRMSLDTPELFRPQLRALLRAAVHGNLKIMFPMVVDARELRTAQEILFGCREELEREGAEVGPLETGVMIETPAAAFCARKLAREADFFSIGTNDLIQYTLAADRGDSRLGNLHRADHPAVLGLIGRTCEAAREADIWVGVCGEAASEAALISKLVELGVTELSMSPPAIPGAKKILSEAKRGSYARS